MADITDLPPATEAQKDLIRMSLGAVANRHGGTLRLRATELLDCALLMATEGEGDSLKIVFHRYNSADEAMAARAAMRGEQH